MSNSPTKLPLFLESYVEFKQHIDNLYFGLSNTVKGAEFAKFSKDVLSTQEDFLKLQANLNSKQSHDRGIDIFWIDPETNTDKKYCQAKFSIRDKDELDSIISKFSSFESAKVPLRNEVIQTSIFDLLNDNIRQETDIVSKSNTGLIYYISTLSSIKNILNLYIKSSRPSVKFYQNLVASNRIKIIDGESLYKLFLEEYLKEYAIPQKVEFNSNEKLVNKKNVFVGIISASDLIKIYNKSGKGIFFENVRDFLGLDARNSALDINNEIFNTALKEPEKMLERNNGITFKADSLDYENETVILQNAGIINGYQTTMCIVKAKPLDNCFIPVKIVLADPENSSKVAKTANNQNKIEKINLELSEYLRPQLVKMSLAEVGLKINDKENPISASSIASSICQQRIFYSDLRYLFIGLFSYMPRNIFISNYAYIKFDDVGAAYPSLENKKYLVSVLGNILTVANQVFESLKEEYPSESNSQESKAKIGNIFNRFYVDAKGYKSYLIVFAICCLLDIDNEQQFKEKDVKKLLERTKEIVENSRHEFEEALKKSFKAIAISMISRSTSKERELDKEIKQNLFKYLERTEFSSFYLIYGTL